MEGDQGYGAPCREHHHHTELHYRLFWEEEERRPYIRQVINMMDVEGDPPIELMHSKEIHTILCCVKEMDRFDVPGLDEDDKMAIISQMEKFHIVDIFDDEKATPEQLKL